MSPPQFMRLNSFCLTASRAQDIPFVRSHSACAKSRHLKNIILQQLFTYFGTPFSFSFCYLTVPLQALSEVKQPPVEFVFFFIAW